MGVLGDMLAVVTIAPVLLDNQTVRTLEGEFPLVILLMGVCWIVSYSPQQYLPRLCSLKLSSTPLKHRNNRIAIGRAAIATAVPDQGPALLDTKGVFMRVSKEKTEGLEIVVNSTQGQKVEIRVSIPKGLLANVDLGGSAGVDVFAVLARNKGGRGGFANETMVPNMCNYYIAPSQTVKLQLEASSKANANGELSRSQPSTLLQLAIPYQAFSATPNTSCQYYNSSRPLVHCRL